MPKGYKNYDAKTKAKIALAAIKGEENLLAICAENKISKSSAIEWRDKLVTGADAIFTPAHEQQRSCQKLKQEIESLHRVLGEMVAENNFFKKKLSG
jgi:transposase